MRLAGHWAPPCGPVRSNAGTGATAVPARCHPGAPAKRQARIELNTEAVRVALQGKTKNPANRNRQGLFLPPEAMEMPLSIEVKKWQVGGKPIKFVADYGTESHVYGPLKSRAHRTTVGIQIPVGKKR